MFELLEAFVTVRLKTDKIKQQLAALINQIKNTKVDVNLGNVATGGDGTRPSSQAAQMKAAAAVAATQIKAAAQVAAINSRSSATSAATATRAASTAAAIATRAASSAAATAVRASASAAATARRAAANAGATAVKAASSAAASASATATKAAATAAATTAKAAAVVAGTTAKTAAVVAGTTTRAAASAAAATTRAAATAAATAAKAAAVSQAAIIRANASAAATAQVAAARAHSIRLNALVSPFSSGGGRGIFQGIADAVSRIVDSGRRFGAIGPLLSAPFELLRTNASISFRILRVGMQGIFNVASRIASGISDVVLAPLRLISSAIFITIRQLVQQILLIPFNFLKTGIQSLLAPTLGFVNLLRQLATTFPLISVGLTGFVLRDLVRFQTRMERIRSVLQFGFGGNIGPQLQFIQKLTKDLGLAATSTAESYAKFSAALIQGGESAASVQSIFTAIAQASAVLGLTVQQQENAFRALEQISSKGKLTAEELRGQLAEALPGALQIAAAGLKKSTQQMEEAIKRGTITTKQFFEAFASEAQRRFAGIAGTAAQRLAGRLNELQNRIDRVRDALGRLVAAPIVEFLESLADTFQRLGGIVLLRNIAIQLGHSFRELAIFMTGSFGQIKRAVESVLPSLERIKNLVIIVNAAAITAIAQTVAKLTELIGGKLGELGASIAAAFGVDPLSNFRLAIGFAVASVNNLGLAFDVAKQKAIQIFNEMQSRSRKFLLENIDTVNKVVDGINKAVQVVAGFLGAIVANLRITVAEFQVLAKAFNLDEIAAALGKLDAFLAKLPGQVNAAAKGIRLAGFNELDLIFDTKNLDQAAGIARINAIEKFNEFAVAVRAEALKIAARLTPINIFGFDLAHPLTSFGGLLSGLQAAFTRAGSGLGQAAGEAFTRRIEASDLPLAGSKESAKIEAGIVARNQGLELTLNQQQLRVQQKTSEQVALSNSLLAQIGTNIATIASKIQPSVAVNIADILIPGL